MKQLDGNLPSDFEEILNKYNGMEAVVKSGKETATVASGSLAEGYSRPPAFVEAEEAAAVVTALIFLFFSNVQFIII